MKFITLYKITAERGDGRGMLDFYFRSPEEAHRVLDRYDGPVKWRRQNLRPVAGTVEAIEMDGGGIRLLGEQVTVSEPSVNAVRKVALAKLRPDEIESLGVEVN
jgi:hypothetical protein